MDDTSWLRKLPVSSAASAAGWKRFGTCRKGSGLWRELKAGDRRLRLVLTMTLETPIQSTDTHFPSIFAHPVQDVSQLGQSINEVGADWADTHTIPVQGGRNHVQHHRPLQHLADKRVLKGIVRVCLDLALYLEAILGSLGHAQYNCPPLSTRPVGPSFPLPPPAQKPTLSVKLDTSTMRLETRRFISASLVAMSL